MISNCEDRHFDRKIHNISFETTVFYAIRELFDVSLPALFQREQNTGKDPMGISADINFFEMEKRSENRAWKRPERRDGKTGFEKKESEKRPEGAKRKRIRPLREERRRSRGFEHERNERVASFQKTSRVKKPKDNELIRLNKYISNSGVCSRREADVLISTGLVSVNGKIVTEMGFKVKPTDVVCYDGKRLNNERKVYVLLNKPKGFITTMDDPQERKTVMSLVANACRERIYPVGRLDRNTMGLLLFTNDGDMTKKLTHPSFGARKIYHVELNKPLTKNDMKTLLSGVELEDGTSKFDDIQYVEGTNGRKTVGVELHSGKNRIVRRMFESLGYNVEKLDRVCFAGLTKKDLPRGRYRFLTEKEIAFLKMV